jgi:3,4-dihydroxy-9,10-secoandrosta-1,3,5(10)-triene-9,17-dione 4,5-dioxygenase
MSIAALGYIRLQSRDPEAWASFATGVLGLMASRQDGDPRLLRMDEHPWRIAVEAGAADRLLATGLQYATEASFRSACEGLRESGVPFTEGSAAECEARAVDAFVSLQDPSGNTLELFHGRHPSATPFSSAIGIERFVTRSPEGGELGLGHVVLPAPQEQATVEFYTTVLGCGVSDRLSLQMPPDSRVTFLHVDNPRQHSLALFNQPHPQGLVHLLVEVETLDQVGKALDRAKQAGHHISASLGRHVNDNMCSFYVLSPGGIAVEYGFDGLLVDWEGYEATESTVGDHWGHEYDFPGIN